MIIRKNTTELTLRSSKEPLATVEVDLDSIPEERCGYGDIVADGLTSWAANNSDETATIYVYESPSVNFREPTNSAFFGVVGKKAVLDGVMTALKRVPKVRVRPSDSILARSASATFHIEGGAVWQVDDEITWFARVADKAESPDSEIEELQLDVDGDGSDDEHPDAPACDVGFPDDDQDWGSDNTTQSHGLRFRKARVDASIGTIRAGIERVFGLPEGSVALCGPDGKPLRSDAKVRTLRKRWE